MASVRCGAGACLAEHLQRCRALYSRTSRLTTTRVPYVGGIPRRRHRHELPRPHRREDRRENVGKDVGVGVRVGVVECQLIVPCRMNCSLCRPTLVRCASWRALSSMYWPIGSSKPWRCSRNSTKRLRASGRGPFTDRWPPSHAGVPRASNVATSSGGYRWSCSGATYLEVVWWY